LESD